MALYQTLVSVVILLGFGVFMYGRTMTLWSTIATVLVFSVVVILADEFLHARMKKRDSTGTGHPGH